MKKLLLVLLLVFALCALVACGEPEEQNEPTESTNVEESTIVEPSTNENEEEDIAPGPETEDIQDTDTDVEVPKNEQEGTAGSNIPLKDNYDAAVLEIRSAMQEYLKEAYGDQIFDARIYVEKIYSYDEEQAIDVLKDLGTDKLAFDVRYEIKPAEGVDPIVFTAGSGVYDEESGWVKEKYNSAILVPNEGGEPAYKVTNMVTGW
jgi:hypothetical protein